MPHPDTPADPDWRPLSTYPLDPRSGEGPVVWLEWRDVDGVVMRGTGVGFRDFDPETRRELVRFAVNGRIVRPLRFRPLMTEAA